MATSTRRRGVRGRIEALAERLSQNVETVTRNSRIFIESSDVDDINPPDNIVEYHKDYRQIGIVRANINQFVRDVTKPGIRLEAEDEMTEAYFMGGDDAPDFAPEGGFLDNCGVMAERRIPFYPFLQSTIVQRWTRGTNLIELTKAEGEKENTEYVPTGFKHIRPETVSARTYSNTNILLDPDDIDVADEITPRGEAAAYVQYDDNSILGPFTDKDEVALSQNDVHRQVLDPDIGGENAEDGVFGVSILEAAADDRAEYTSIKRDRAEAIKRKAYGVWTAQFNTEFVESELAEESILLDWDDDEQDDWISDVDSLGPGDILGHDGSIILDQWEPQVPELTDTLQHYVDDILAPLPAPKYATGHGEQITQHVTDRQENAYEDTIRNEREYQERSWTQVFRFIAERHDDLDPAGLRFKIEPEEEASPIMSMDDDEVERLKTYADAVKQIEMVTTLTEEEKRELLLQLPGTPDLGSLEELDVEMSDPSIQDMAEELTGSQPAEADD